MIIEVNNNNLEEIKNSFINVEFLTKEFENNPFAKILIYKEDNIVIGYIYYSDIYDRAEINQFEIDINHRNCGKGKILLNELLKTVDKDVTLVV